MKHDALSHFLRELRVQQASTPEGHHHCAGIVYDVGANNGAWSDDLMRRATRSSSGRLNISLHMVEPQMAFAVRLTTIARRWNATYLPAAASSFDGRVDFFKSKNSEAASVLSSAAVRYANQRYAHRKSERVRAVHLARDLESTWRAHNASCFRYGLRPLLFVKMDVEGGEAQLLPSLLTSGALCLVDVLCIEWHLNALPPEQRLAAVALRLGLRSHLVHGCSRTPPGATGPPLVPGPLVPGPLVPGPLSSREAWRQEPSTPPGFTPHPRPRLVVEHEEYRPINHGQIVPGLLEEMVKHMPGYEHRRDDNNTWLLRGSTPEHQLNYTLAVTKKPMPGRTLLTTIHENFTAVHSMPLGRRHVAPTAVSVSYS